MHLLVVMASLQLLEVVSIYTSHNHFYCDVIYFSIKFFCLNLLYN